MPAKGVERWLTQRLSHRLGADEHGNGVCAGVDFVRPASLIGLLTDTDDADPWDPERLVWRVLSVVDASLDEPWCDPLARHLGKGHEGDAYELRQERRWTVARRIAGLFAGYARDRPRMLEDWATGGDGDGAGGHVDPDLTWQPELWRRVAAEIDAPTPVQRHRATVAAIRAGSAARPAGPAVAVRLHPAGGHRARAGGRGRGGSRGPPLAAGALPRRLGVAGRGRRGRTGQATRRHRGRGRPPSALRRARPGRPRDATLAVDPRELRCGATRLAPSTRTQTPSSAGSSTTSAPTPCRTATPGPPAT